jgi:hypothetical protein
VVTAAEAAAIAIAHKINFRMIFSLLGAQEECTCLFRVPNIRRVWESFDYRSIAFPIRVATRDLSPEAGPHSRAGATIGALQVLRDQIRNRTENPSAAWCSCRIDGATRMAQSSGIPVQSLKE